MVASKLDLTHVLACNVGMGCAGGVQALQATFNQLLADSARGKISTYVLVTGDHISRMIDRESWKTAILFSDGISAVVVTNDPEATGGFVIEHVASECYAGESVDVINLPNSLAHRESAEPKVCLLQMRGRGVFEFGTRIVPRVRELSGVEDFSKFYIIPHQANVRMLNELPTPFGIRDEQLYTDGITKIGNISGAACFLGLEDCMKRGLDDQAEKVLLCAFGAELQVAVAVLSR
jgi:3-oxoacyl-[acyl-carrier-protein] synthase-3